MKKILMCIPFLITMSCETGSRGGKKYSEARGNMNKTSIYGGCDNQTECWDYKGSSFRASFENSQLAAQCRAEGGQYVSNGCTDQEVIVACEINKNTDAETVLHFYQKSGLTEKDAEDLCAAQGGVIRSKE